MMLVISILLGINFIIDLINKQDAGTFTGIALVISLWNLCFPLAVIVMIIIGLLIIGGVVKGMRS